MFQNLTGVFVGSNIWHFDSVVASNYALRTVCPKTVCTQLLRKGMFRGPYGVSFPDNWIPTPLTGILYCFVLFTPISGAESPWNKRHSAIIPKTGMPRLKQKLDQYLKVNLTSQTMLSVFLCRQLGRHRRHIHLTEQLWSLTQSGVGLCQNTTWSTQLCFLERARKLLRWYGSTNHSPNRAIKPEPVFSLLKFDMVLFHFALFCFCFFTWTICSCPN